MVLTAIVISVAAVVAAVAGWAIRRRQAGRPMHSGDPQLEPTVVVACVLIAVIAAINAYQPIAPNLVSQVQTEMTDQAALDDQGWLGGP